MRNRSATKNFSFEIIQKLENGRPRGEPERRTVDTKDEGEGKRDLYYLFRALQAITDPNPKGKMLPSVWKTLPDWQDFPLESLFRAPAVYYRRKKNCEKGWRCDNPAADLEKLFSGAEDTSKNFDSQSGLGVIGNHIFDFLSRETNGEHEFRLSLESYHDLKVVRTEFRGVESPPFAYIGEWSEDSRHVLEQNVIVAALLWSDDSLRRSAKDWVHGISSNNPFLLNLPPLSHYKLNLKGNFNVLTEESERKWMFDDVELFLELPHRAKCKIVTAIPSLLCLNSKFSKEPATLLISSPHLRKVVEEMSALWKDKSTRKVLLIAPPGSGKEVIAKFLHAGNVYYEDNGEMAKIELPEASFAGMDVETVRKTVFGSWNHKYGRRKTLLPSWTGGLLLNAKGTMIFLDEIDKCDEPILSSLLRFLENDEIQPEGWSEPVKLEGSRYEKYKCRLLFAGSMTRTEMMKRPPLDFWTRIEKVIEIVHPLEIHSTEERRRCIQEYFIMFLYRNLEKKIKEMAKRNIDDANTDLQRVVKAIPILLGTSRLSDDEVKKTLDSYVVAVNDNRLVYPFLYFDASQIMKISNHVAWFLSLFPPAMLSVRNLKSIVSQLEYRISLYKERRIDLLAIRMPSDQSESDLDNGETHSDSDKSKAAHDRDQRHLEKQWIWMNLHEITISIR